MDITLVIPTYNEAGNIPVLVDKVFSIFSENKLDGNIIIIDDDSPDQTWSVAENLMGKYPNLEVLRRLDKRGLSSAVLDGFALANTEIVGVIDADLSHPPEKIPELVAPIINGEADFTLGSRYIYQGGTENWPLKRRLSSKIATLAVLGLTKVKDPMSGFFFLKKDRIKDVELSPKGFKIGLEILVRGNCEKVIEVPIVFRDREYGESKLSSNVISDYLLHVLKLYMYRIFK
jgi:dolichol-phosphate mannosyltransferase